MGYSRHFFSTEPKSTKRVIKKGHILARALAMATMATAWSGALASAWLIRVPRRGPMRASRAIRTGSVTFEANRFGSKPIIGTRSRTTAAAAKKKNKEDESESYTFD